MDFVLFPLDPLPFLLRIAWLATAVGAAGITIRLYTRQHRRAMLLSVLIISGVACLWFTQTLFYVAREGPLSLANSSLMLQGAIVLVGATSLLAARFVARP